MREDQTDRRSQRLISANMYHLDWTSKIAPASAKSDTQFCSEKLKANECTIIHLLNQNWI